MNRHLLELIFYGALFLAPTLVFAHPHPQPHVHGGFAAGLIHPILGLDHLLAFLGVGLWASQQSDRRAVWLIPMAFLGIMIAGFALGVGSTPLPLVEFGIVGSLALVGVLILGNRQLPVFVGASLAGLFAVFHGHAHGAEMDAGLSSVSFGSGFVAASGLLLLAGAAAWRLAEQRMLQQPISRSAGITLVASSAVFLVLLF